MKIGIIGCCNMGGGTATHLLASGQAVTCFDPDPATLTAIVAWGATGTADAQTLAKTRDLIILSLPKAAIVVAVMTNITPHIRAGAIILDTSTSLSATSQGMAAIGDKHGFTFIDDPASGGPAAAKSGTMTMFLGGDAVAIKFLKPVLDILTVKTVVVGKSVAGHAAKIANNMLCAANLVLVFEALCMASPPLTCWRASMQARGAAV